MTETTTRKPTNSESDLRVLGRLAKEISEHGTAWARLCLRQWTAELSTESAKLICEVLVTRISKLSDRVWSLEAERDRLRAEASGLRDDMQRMTDSMIERNGVET